MEKGYTDQWLEEERELVDFFQNKGFVTSRVFDNSENYTRVGLVHEAQKYLFQQYRPAYREALVNLCNVLDGLGGIVNGSAASTLWSSTVHVPQDIDMIFPFEMKEEVGQRLRSLIESNTITEIHEHVFSASDRGLLFWYHTPNEDITIELFFQNMNMHQPPSKGAKLFLGYDNRQVVYELEGKKFSFGGILATVQWNLQSAWDEYQLFQSWKQLSGNRRSLYETKFHERLEKIQEITRSYQGQSMVALIQDAGDHELYYDAADGLCGYLDNQG